VCDVMESRIVLPAALDDEQRYDVALILPHDEHSDQMHRRIREGIGKHFQVSISSEACATDVLVLTAPNGIAEAAASIDGGVGGAGFVATGAGRRRLSNPDARRTGPPTEEEIRKMGIELLKSVAAGPAPERFSR